MRDEHVPGKISILAEKSDSCAGAIHFSRNEVEDPPVSMTKVIVDVN